MALSTDRLRSFLLTCSHVIFIGKLIDRALSQVFSNVPKKIDRWIKKWIKHGERSRRCTGSCRFDGGIFIFRCQGGDWNDLTLTVVP